MIKCWSFFRRYNPRNWEWERKNTGQGRLRWCPTGPAIVSCVLETQLDAQEVHPLGHMWTGNMENHALERLGRGRKVQGAIFHWSKFTVQGDNFCSASSSFIQLLWQLIMEPDPSVAFHPIAPVALEARNLGHVAIRPRCRGPAKASAQPIWASASSASPKCKTQTDPSPVAWSWLWDEEQPLGKAQLKLKQRQSRQLRTQEAMAPGESNGVMRCAW